MQFLNNQVFSPPKIHSELLNSLITLAFLEQLKEASRNGRLVGCEEGTRVGYAHGEGAGFNGTWLGRVCGIFL